MSRPYALKPCCRCGGDKRADGVKTTSRYCAPCSKAVHLEWLSRHAKWWCGACDYRWQCDVCLRNKREQFREAMRLRSQRRHETGNQYFRPFNAEKFWQSRAHSIVAAAVRRGLLPNLKAGEYACADCGGVAYEYDHRDYSRPLDVQPVCRACNSRRGTAKWPTAEQFQFARLTTAGAEAA